MPILMIKKVIIDIRLSRRISVVCPLSFIIVFLSKASKVKSQYLVEVFLFETQNKSVL